MFRPMAFAGSWYPSDPTLLQQQIKQAVQAAQPIWVPHPKVLIVPHAGHLYSAALLARAVAQLSKEDDIRRLVVFAPSHQHLFNKIAFPEYQGYLTPLGCMPLDTEAATIAKQFAFVVAASAAHRHEHAIEVVLPFFQYQLGNLPLLPLVVGRVEQKQLEALLMALWGDQHTLIVISTDLSHYLNVEQQSRLDAQTAKCIEEANSKGLSSHQACGHQALEALLAIGQRRGLRFTRLGLSHSGLVNGDLDRVVGYGAWAVQESAHEQLSAPLRALSLAFARRSIAAKLDGSVKPIDPSTLPAPLQGLGASFVTLRMRGELRGCIGSLSVHRSLAEDLRANARSAAFADPRFPALSLAELAECQIEISILSRPVAINVASEAELLEQLQLNVDGLILTEGGHRATFLPSVWEELSTPLEFLAHLKRKAGLPANYWSETLRFERYRSESFAETAPS